MYTVTVRAPDGAEASYPLGKDQGLIVGRDDGCDIVLPSKRVSRRHARFFTDGERLHIEDLGSQNGVFVGGARLTGTSEVRPGPAIEIGEFKIRIRKADPRAVEAQSGVDVNVAAEGVLKGLGEMAGRELKLPKDRGFVGRDAEREVSIDNDSVSRKHAEIRLEAGMVHVVVDLASSNGTFVNGERLKPNLPSRLKHGDKVRFGETHWQYVAGASSAGKVTLTPRLKMVVAVVAVVFVLAIAMKLWTHGTTQTKELSDDTPTVSTEDVLAQGQQAMNEERFADAKSAFQKVVDANPLNDRARLALRQADKELRNQKLFSDANGKADVGRDADALKLFVQIDTDSGFFARARLRVQQLATGVMKRESARCRSADTRREAKTALEACARYLDYQCQLGTPDADALKNLRQAEKTEHDHSAWVCPPDLAAWFGNGERREANDPTAAIARRFPDKEVQEAIAAYLKGDLDQAQHLMAKAKGKSAVADDLSEALAIVAARYKEGDAAFRSGQLRDMKTSFDAALQADQKLVPEGLTSFSGRDMKARVARMLFDQGQTAFSQQTLPDAFDAWQSGLSYDPSNVDLHNGMLRLEKKVDEVLDDSPSCDDLRLAQRVTLETSGAHQRAMQLFQKRGCQ